MKFAYLAFDRLGKQATGSIDATAIAEAREELRKKGLFVTEIREDATGDAALGYRSSSAPNARGWGRGKRLAQLAAFTRQLHVLISSGTPLVQSLAALERQARDEVWRTVIVDVRSRVEEGVPLSQAMLAHPQYFDDVCRSLVSAGEGSGRLDAMLERLAKLVRAQLHIRSSIIGAMIYPIVLTCISTGVLVILLTFVLPRFAALFANLGTPLPPTTKFVMQVSALLRGYWWAMVLGCAAAIFGLRAWVRTPKGKRIFDSAVIKAPVLGKMVASFATARMSRLLGIQVEAKVPLLDALRLTRMAVNNVLYRELIVAAEDAATQGQSVSSAFAASNLISPTITEALRSGEQTGQVAPLLINIADFLDEENDVVIRSLTSIIEPVILVVLGILVGFVALSMFLPLFDLTAATGGGGGG
jgi:type II secretory pathway component PulF